MKICRWKKKKWWRRSWLSAWDDTYKILMQHWFKWTECTTSFSIVFCTCFSTYCSSVISAIIIHLFYSVLYIFFYVFIHLLWNRHRWKPVQVCICLWYVLYTDEFLSKVIIEHVSVGSNWEFMRTSTCVTFFVFNLWCWLIIWDIVIFQIWLVFVSVITGICLYISKKNVVFGNMTHK